MTSIAASYDWADAENSWSGDHGHGDIKECEIVKASFGKPKTIEPASAPSDNNRWLAYLTSLSDEHIVSQQVTRAAQILWNEMSLAVPAITPPNARPTDDDDDAEGLRMSWNRNRAYLDIVISPSGLFEWFYTDITNAYEGRSALPPNSPPDELLTRLRGLF
jgi:hypothetical protein